MGAYHEAAFTLDPTVQIPEDAAPAIGVEEFGTGEQIKQASDAQLVATLSWTLSGSEVTFTIEPVDELPEDATATIQWDFGNGRHETGHDLVQRCTYLTGVYPVSAVMQIPGRTSLTFETTVTV